MNQDVFLSILAMDSYNRGYGQGVNNLLDSSGIGSATFDTQSLVVTGSDPRNVGFYAIAYDWDGNKVISYRGTDFDPQLPSRAEFLNSPISSAAGVLNSPFVKDIWNGWGLGAGFAGGEHAQLAIKFFEDVADRSIYSAIGNGTPVLLTGHSLGGGLAGFVGSLSSTQAYGFDHMPFGVAAYAQVLPEAIFRAATEHNLAFTSINDLLISIELNSFDDIANGVTTLIEFAQSILDNLAELEPNVGILTGYYVEGEVLEYVRNGTDQISVGGSVGSVASLFGPVLGSAISAAGGVLDYTTDQLETDEAEEFSIYGAELGAFNGVIANHSISLLTTLLFAEKQWESEGGRTDWQQSIKFILPATMDASIAENSFRLGKGETGASAAGSQLSTIIAYSAVNEGTRPFGDTGIRALFNDADDLGAVSNFLPSFIDDDVKFDIGTVLTKYAGLLANDKIMSADVVGATDGVLTFLDESSGEKALLIDLTDDRWLDKKDGILSPARPTQDSANPEDSIQELAHDLISTTLAQGTLSAVNSAFVIDELQAWLGQQQQVNTSDAFGEVDWITLSATGGQLFQPASDNYTLIVGTNDNENRTVGQGPVIVLAAGGDDRILGSGEADALLGGQGNDTLIGGIGDDWFFGDSGNDVIWGNVEGDVAGVSGHDTVVYGADPGSVRIRYEGNSTLPSLTVATNGGVDQLRGIDEVFLESGQSIFSINGNIAPETSIIINNGVVNNVRGQILDVSSMRGDGVLIALNTDNGSLISDKSTGGKIQLNGFNTQIIATSGNDDIYDGSGEEKIINGLGGDDVISVAGTEAAAVIFGGDGVDDITGGDGSDIIIDIDRDDVPVGEYASVSGGAGNDTIILEGVAAHIDGGAGNDIVDISRGSGAYTFTYRQGDGIDTIDMHGQTSIEYTLLSASPVGSLSQPFVRLDLSEFAASDISAELVVTSSRIIREDLPNRDFKPIWELGGSLIVTVAGSGAMQFDNVFFIAPTNNGASYGTAPFGATAINLTGVSNGGGPVSISTANGGSVFLSIGGGLDAESSPIVAGGLTMANADFLQQRLPTEDQEVSLARGVNVYTGGTGHDRFVVTWALDTLQSSLTGQSITITDKWNLITDTTLTDFDEIYVVETDTSYTVAEFNAVLVQRNNGVSEAGTSGSDTLNGTDNYDRLFGNEGNDTLIGLGGADILDGGVGSDTMTGGAGDDQYFIDDVGDVAAELMDEGRDQIVASIDYTLLEHFEDLELRGSAMTGTGNSVDNIIAGTSDSNSLFGMGGSDVLYGRDGNDILTGGIGDDALFGDADDDELFGDSGNDNLIGGLGDDIIHGGADNDTLFGSDGQDILNGGEGNDNLSGGEESDILSGGKGHDRLTGGAGYDIASYADLTDAVIANLVTGFTQKTRGGGTETLVEIEGLIGTDFGDTLTGSDVDSYIDAGGGSDTIVGGTGYDELYGGDGNDTITGGRGDDTLIGGDGDDVFRYATGDGLDSIDGGEGFDVIRAISNNARLSFADISDIESISAGGYSNVNLFGTANDEVIDLSGVILDGIGFIDARNGNDIVIGTSGNDVFRAGNGADIFTGGDGADTYIFQQSSDGLVASYDKITDFQQGSDIIDLSGVDANSTISGTQAFTFIGNAAFSGVAGELRAFRAQNSGLTRIQGDLNGDGSVDFLVELNGLYILTTSDFVL